VFTLDTGLLFCYTGCMLTAIVVAGASLVFLFFYSTIGVAAHKIAREKYTRVQPPWGLGCSDCQNGQHRGRACFHWERNQKWEHLQRVLSWGLAVAWPLVLSGLVAAKCALFAARGPRRLGGALADQALGREHQSRKSALQRLSPEELRALEIECGLT